MRLKVLTPAEVDKLAAYFNSNLVRLKGFSDTAKKVYKTNFNSNLVRLKASPKSACGNIWRNFNSNLVRLKDLKAFERLLKPSKFQFQFGAIKRCRREIFKRPHADFNSNLVRLKVSSFELDNVIQEYFNSNLVRLKVRQQQNEIWKSLISIPIWCD